MIWPPPNPEPTHPSRVGPIIKESNLFAYPRRNKPSKYQPNTHHNDHIQKEWSIGPHQQLQGDAKFTPTFHCRTTIPTQSKILVPRNYSLHNSFLHHMAIEMVTLHHLKLRPKQTSTGMNQRHWRIGFTQQPQVTLSPIPPSSLLPLSKHAQIRSGIQKAMTFWHTDPTSSLESRVTNNPTIYNKSPREKR